MSTRSDCAAAVDALHQAFLVNLIADAESQLYEKGFNSASSRSSTDSSYSSSSDDEPLSWWVSSLFPLLSFG